MGVKFVHPAWLAGGLLACLYLLWLWRRHDARQYAALARFVSAHLREELTRSVSIARRRLRRFLMLAALALVFVALAGPQIGYRWELTSRRGNEIVFALDTSRSMSTPDVKPDRLTRAKLAIDDFTNRLDGDAVGLVAFAGDAFLVCPITLDYGAFHESLDAVDINTIPRGGTNIASAIREAQSALRRRPGGDKILILATDGEDLEGDALVAAQAAVRQDGLKIFTIGVGTPQGDLIPLPSNQGGGFVKDESGNLVKSRLDESALKAIAAATGGLYAPLGAQGQGFETIYDVGLAPMLKHDLASRQQKVYIERYQWPLCASLLLLLASLLIGTRRRFAARRRPQPAEASRASPSLTLWLFTALSSACFMPGSRAHAATTNVDDKPVVQYNRGTAAYRAGQFPEAAKAFQESINRAPSADAQRLADQEDAYYNLGNTLYRSGQKTEASAPEQTLKTWTQAVKAYETALQLRSDDADSKYNRDFVKRKIDELKQKQNQPPPQNSNQGNPPPNQPPNQGQPPQQPDQGNSPPNQQPPQPPNTPPPNQPQPPSQQPPPNQPSGQQPPAQQPPAQPPPGQPPPGAGQPKPAPGTEPPTAPGSGADPSDTERQPGRMSREEARELLDSEKGEERHARGLPYARRDTDSPPDKPVRDW